MKNLKSFFVIRTSYIFYLFLIAINFQLSTINCFSQSFKEDYSLQVKKITIPDNLLLKSSKSTQGRWYNYAAAMQNSIFPTGGNAMYGVRLFPDTTVNIQYTPQQLAPPWVHAIAVVLDPKADVFYDEKQPLNMTKLSKYRVDSIGLFCEYNRNIADPEIVDTLIVEIIANLRIPVYSFVNQTSNYGYDTVKFIGLAKGAKNLNYVKPDAKTEFITKKIPLSAQTAADTISNGMSYVSFPTGLSNYYGSLCAVTFKFKPGYKWTPYQDILNKDLNEFLFFSYEENGPDTYLNYTPGNYNCSQILATQTLRPKDYWYKQGLYMPSFAFVRSYQLENHNIDFKLVSNNVEINEVRSLKSDVRIYPNPAAELTTINYQLSTNSNVKLFISDLTGKMIMEFNPGFQSAGIHNIIVNTSDLSSGMYFYNLSTEYSVFTGKIIIKK